MYSQKYVDYLNEKRIESAFYISAICVWTRSGTSSVPTTFPSSSRSCWRKTVCVLSVSTICASLLLANGVPMKQIQEWLGHSDFSTIANIYAHLDYASKLSSAQAMMEGLGYGNASA